MFRKTVIKQRRQLIELNEENKTLYKENKNLKSENAELFSFRYRVIDIIEEKGTIVSKYDKIKELVDNLQTDNKL